MSKLSSILLTFVLFLSSFSLKAQSEVELAVQLIIPDVIAEKCLDDTAFYTWLGTVSEEYEEQMKAQVGNFESLLLINLVDSGDVEFSLSCRPPIAEEVRTAILNKIRDRDNFNTKFGEYTFFIRAKVNKGAYKKTASFFPPVVFPREKRIQKFQSLSLLEKTRYLKKWTDEEVIPVLALFQLEVDPKFEGVRGVGHIMDERKFEGKLTDNYLDTNYLYWRAVLEMNKGNQLIPFSRICMHLSNEEWDIAHNYMEVTTLFAQKNSVASYYFEELKDLLKMLREQLHLEIKEGIKLHDQGKFEQAQLKYATLLRMVPKSAFLQYEAYLTESTMALGEGENGSSVRPIWDRYRDAIYQANPQYPSMAQANTGMEGYELVCRSMIKDLFKDKAGTKNDLLKYADLCIEVGDYSFAAHLYWWLFTYLGNDAYEGREMLNDFLYALHLAGEDQVITNFDGDFVDAFKQIEQRRKEIREADTMYQAFEKKE